MSKKQTELKLDAGISLSAPPMRTHWDNKPTGGVDLSKMPHMTTPDMSMSVLDIITKFGSGSVPLNVGHRLYYDGIGHEVDLEDDILAGRHWDSLDIVEKHDILKRAQNDFSRINKGIKEAQKEKAKKLEAERRQEAEQRKKFDEWVKTQNKENEKK